MGPGETSRGACPVGMRDKSRLLLFWNLRTFLPLVQDYQEKSLSSKRGLAWSKRNSGQPETNLFFMILSAGVELTGTSFSEITATISRVTFVLSDTYYKRGVPFFGQVGKP